MKIMYFNIVGNPIDGFRLIGPFNNFGEALDWQEGCDESCWVIDNELPNN